MLLQILVMLLLAVVLARPFIFGTALTGGRSILVIDTSASMLAEDVEPSRLGQAIDAARGMIDDMKPADEAMLIAAGPDPLVLSGFTNDKSQLSGALGQADDGAGGAADINAALKLASSVVGDGKARVVVFSDGAVPDLDPFATGELKIDFYPVGQDSRNVGIVNAGARRNPFDDRYELFVALHSFYGAPREVEVSFSVAGQPIDVQTLTIEAGKRAEITVPNMPHVAEPIEVSIDNDDPLDADDVAYISMPGQVEYNVALATSRESLLLRKVLGSLRDVNVFELKDNTLVGASEDAQVHVYVVDGSLSVPVDPEASYLFIDTASHALLPVQTGETVETNYEADPPVIPAVVGQQRSHPLLRYVNAADLRLGAMRRTQLQPWARTIVDASEGPLVVEGMLDGQRTVYLAFDIYQSDFPLRAAFPVFMANAIRYLGEAASGQARAVAAGERVDLLAPLQARRVEVTGPDGRMTNQTLGSRDFTLGRTAQAGLYRLEYFGEDGGQVGADVVPVSLLNDAESNLAPAQTLRVRGAEEALAAASGEQVQEIVGRREVRVNREFYTWLILAVLLLISVEWWAYHQRTL